MNKNNKKTLDLLSFPFHRIETATGEIHAFEAVLRYAPEVTSEDRFCVVVCKGSGTVERIFRRSTMQESLLDLGDYLLNKQKRRRAFTADQLLTIEHFAFSDWLEEAMEIAWEIPAISIFDAKQRMTSLDSFAPIRAQSKALRSHYRAYAKNPSDHGFLALLPSLSKNAMGLYSVDFMHARDQEDLLERTFDALVSRGELHTLREGHAVLRHLNQKLSWSIRAGDDNNIAPWISLDFPVSVPGPGDWDVDHYPLCAALKVGNMEVVNALFARDPKRCAAYFCTPNPYSILIPESIKSEVLAIGLAYGDRLQGADAWRQVLVSDIPDEQIRDFICRNEIDVNTAVDWRCSLIAVATEYGLVDRFDLLLSLGADPDQKNVNGLDAWESIRSDGSSERIRSALEAAILRSTRERRTALSASDCGIGL